MLKKLIALLLAMLTLFSATACMGEFQFGRPPESSGTEEEEGGGSGYVPPEMNDDPTDDFTVTLMADGQPYTPLADNMFAYWNDGSSIHTARFDKNGVARIDGLDGNYRVSVTNVPSEYTYNPNGYEATNLERNIVVDLYTLNFLTGGGTGMYDCYIFQKTGVYCATIENENDAIFFQYAPDGMGEYSIESWVDVVADNVNPSLDVYIGSSAWKQYSYSIDRSEGAQCGSYTLNFIHTVQIAEENISSGGGQAVYTFAVKAESKNNKYPLVVTFAVKRDGDFELPDSVGPGGSVGQGKVMAAPKYDFSNYNVADHEYNKNAVGVEYLLSGNTYVFDDRTVKLWEKRHGGDDFYHLYDEEKYAETGGYGPILYAYITTKTRFVDQPFTKMEYNSSGEIINNALSSNGVNYKHLIEGYTALAKNGYYCISGCPCHDEADEPKLPVCEEGCTECTAYCRQCSTELVGFEGYQAYANSDGLVPVTAEIQQFLAGYCGKADFFRDGQGSLENKITNGRYYQAVGDSGWLFACAYYPE